ncbi:hypothetical protein BDZ97DRAFT_2031536 [Flammula alnicola]|nr:hypothetical protein BDZ97DRAFT_2031536 [Flammula alnicola]
MTRGQPSCPRYPNPSVDTVRPLESSPATQSAGDGRGATQHKSILHTRDSTSQQQSQQITAQMNDTAIGNVQCTYASCNTPNSNTSTSTVHRPFSGRSPRVLRPLRSDRPCNFLKKRTSASRPDKSTGLTFSPSSISSPGDRTIQMSTFEDSMFPTVKMAQPWLEVSPGDHTIQMSTFEDSMFPTFNMSWIEVAPAPQVTRVNTDVGATWTIWSRDLGRMLESSNKVLAERHNLPSIFGKAMFGSAMFGNSLTLPAVRTHRQCKHCGDFAALHRKISNIAHFTPLHGIVVVLEYCGLMYYVEQQLASETDLVQGFRSQVVTFHNNTSLDISLASLLTPGSLVFAALSMPAVIRVILLLNYNPDDGHLSDQLGRYIPLFWESTVGTVSGINTVSHNVTRFLFLHPLNMAKRKAEGPAEASQKKAKNSKNDADEDSGDTAQRMEQPAVQNDADDDSGDPAPPTEKPAVKVAVIPKLLDMVAVDVEEEDSRQVQPTQRRESRAVVGPSLLSWGCARCRRRRHRLGLVGGRWGGGWWCRRRRLSASRFVAIHNLRRVLVPAASSPAGKGSVGLGQWWLTAGRGGLCRTQRPLSSSSRAFAASASCFGLAVRHGMRGGHSVGVLLAFGGRRAAVQADLHTHGARQ